MTRTGGGASRAGRSGVVQVVQSIDRGGLEMMAVELAVALRERGLPSALIATEGGGRLEGRLRDARVDLYLLDRARWSRPSTHVAVGRLLNRLRPAAVHTHSVPPLLLTAPAATVVGRPRIVHTEHAPQYLDDAPHVRPVLRVLSRAVDAFVVVAAEMIPYFAETVGVDRHRLRVIVNGVDTDRFRPIGQAALAERRQALGLPPGLVVGAVGRLAAVKNFPMLLRGIAAARGPGADLRLALVGDGEEGESLRALAATLGISDRVHFLGWRTDVPELIASFDVLALTSWSEGLPLVVLEAMSAGVPVVSTAVGDVARVLDAGTAGTVVPIDDAGALATELVRLAADARVRRSLGDAGRARVLAHYSHRAMVDAYVDAYGLGDVRSRAA